MRGKGADRKKELRTWIPESYVYRIFQPCYFRLYGNSYGGYLITALKEHGTLKKFVSNERAFVGE